MVPEKFPERGKGKGRAVAAVPSAGGFAAETEKLTEPPGGRGKGLAPEMAAARAKDSKWLIRLAGLSVQRAEGLIRAGSPRVRSTRRIPDRADKRRGIAYAYSFASMVATSWRVIRYVGMKIIPFPTMIPSSIIALTASI